MCLSCLDNQLVSIDEYDKELTEFLSGMTCECCMSYPKFLKRLNGDLKVLCLTKKKKHTETMDFQGWKRILTLEEAFKMKIDQQLQEVMEQLDDAKGELTDEGYLSKANQLKSLKDMVKNLEDAEHR